MISYYVLKFMKKLFPEFMLAKTFDQILQDFEFMNEFPYTYESDFSSYDSTNCFFLRNVVDYDFMYML
jgi:hypothetical protein